MTAAWTISATLILALLLLLLLCEGPASGERGVSAGVCSAFEDCIVVQELELVGAVVGASGFAPATMKSLCCCADIVPATSFEVVEVEECDVLRPKGHEHRQYVCGTECIVNNKGM